ncbi:energy transducer TonB [bacterium]|nr:energy transducer TonB [bacterium]
MKKFTAIASLILALTFVVGSVYAGETTDVTTPTEEIAAGYTAPVLKEMVRPGRVFVNNREIEGFVTLELMVDESGKVEKAKVLYRTSQLAVMNAVDAASQWTFEPAKLNGQAVKSYIAYNVPFGRELDAFQEKEYASSVVGNYSDLASK